MTNRKSRLINKLAAASLFEYLVHMNKTMSLNAAIQTKTQMHCALTQTGTNNTHKLTHTRRNCFPVVALGKLKLHYGPPEGSGERG